MSASEKQEEKRDHGLTAASSEPDQPASENGAVEFDERRAKMERLRAEGVDPYPAVTLWATRTRIADVLAANAAATLEAGEPPELSYQIAGRLISRRGHGKTAFLDVRDLSGQIQVVVRVDALGQEVYDRILGLDIGDILAIDGCVYITQRGQLALAVKECTLLTKTLRPPPDKHHGLGDTGTRYHYRALAPPPHDDTRELFIPPTATASSPCSPTRTRASCSSRATRSSSRSASGSTFATSSRSKRRRCSRSPAAPARGRSPRTTTRSIATCTCGSPSSCS